MSASRYFLSCIYFGKTVLTVVPWCLRRSILENGEVDRDDRGRRETQRKVSCAEARVPIERLSADCHHRCSKFTPF